MPDSGSSRKARLSLRIDFPNGARLGPGKINLLAAITEQGSISGAGRAMKMSYRRAWLLVDEINRMFRAPLVALHQGGVHGGGARLTPEGEAVMAQYRAIEHLAYAHGARHFEALEQASSETLGDGRTPSEPQG